MQGGETARQVDRDAHARLQPAGEGEKLCIIYHALDAARVQRDTMMGPTNRMFVSIAETASASAPNEITVSGTAARLSVR